MIIKKFEEIVQRYPGKTALKMSSKSLTYAELDFYANRVAHALADEEKDTTTGINHINHQQVALLFDHGIDMVVAIIGALKANKTYVPLDTYFPGKRLLYILEDCQAEILLTDNRNHELARELSEHAGQKIRVLNIETIGAEIPGTTFPHEASEERTAYILYTSGSTGKPKGVYQIHRNVWYYTRNWIKRFSITESDRMSLLTSFCHDGSVQDMFSALLAGATLYPYFIKNTGNTDEPYHLLIDEKLTIWHSVPTLYRYFANTLTGKDVFNDIRWVLLGGEPLRTYDLDLYRTYFPAASLANVYGQTESSVSTICTITPKNTFDDVCLGEPLDETKILLVTEEGNTVETIGVGEIVVACDYIAPGYWKDHQAAEEVFTHDEELGRLYWTGDLGRLTLDGLIKAMGRKDFQIKIRGFRVETGEIESVLMRHPLVEEAVVLAKEDENLDTYLCAYIVSGGVVTPSELREFLAAELPDYMIPRYFISLEQMPLTPNGKIDRKSLPEPEPEITLEAEYQPPGTGIEKKIAAIWQEVLGVERIGIDDNFISRGGHSLLVISIIAKIHQEFNVELQLNDVFDHPTIRKLSEYITRAETRLYYSIEAKERKEYYQLSPPQKGLYALQKIAPTSTAYNEFIAVILEEDVDLDRLVRCFNTLIRRHESLRTSFIMPGENPVQWIHDEVEFGIEYYDLGKIEVEEELSSIPGGTRGSAPLPKKPAARSPQSATALISSFIRPFDLSRAPLLRVGLIKLKTGKHIFMVDMHHIVSDGTSMILLTNEFIAIYSDDELLPLRLQYKDYCEWQQQLLTSGKLKEQEAYWLKFLEGELPVLDLPTDFPRPKLQSFEGDILFFEVGEKETGALRALALQEGATLQMVMLTIFYILLARVSRQEDIIVGIPITGRWHADLGSIIGMFVNTLALRNFPVKEKTFLKFLQEVKKNSLDAYDNQDYQFESLVKKLGARKDTGRNPLFDVIFEIREMQAVPGTEEAANVPGTPGKPGTGIPQLHGEPYGFNQNTTKFDLDWNGEETPQGIRFWVFYCTKLFAKESIELLKDRYLALVAAAIENPRAKIQELEHRTPLEKELDRVQEVKFNF